MCWVQLLTLTIQFLCISITKILLHVTLKRRAEISADIFARLLRYFGLSCKILTIIISYCINTTKYCTKPIFCGIDAITVLSYG